MAKIVKTIKPLRTSRTKRSLYIDVMKGLLMILVVIGHLPFFDYNSRTIILIYSFHMPAFLIIGGILSHVDEKTKFSQILYKRFTGILVPYFIFYLISLVIIPIKDYEYKTQAVIYMFNGIGNPDYAVNLPLWFLTFYFCAITLFELIECFFYKIKIFFIGKKTPRKSAHLELIEIPTLIFIAILMYFAYKYARIDKLPRLPYNFEIAVFCLGFVYFGKMLGLFIPKAYKYIKKNTALTVFSCIATVLFVTVFSVIWYKLSLNNGRIDLNARDYKNSFYMYFDAIIGFVIFAFFSFVISFLPIVKNILSFIGQRSLYILAYHVPSTIITYNIIIPHLPLAVGTIISSMSFLSVAILTTCGIVISLIFSCIHKACNIPA